MSQPIVIAQAAVQALSSRVETVEVVVKEGGGGGGGGAVGNSNVVIASGIPMLLAKLDQNGHPEAGALMTCLSIYANPQTGSLTYSLPWSLPANFSGGEFIHEALMDNSKEVKLLLDVLMVPGDTDEADVVDGIVRMAEDSSTGCYMYMVPGSTEKNRAIHIPPGASRIGNLVSKTKLATFGGWKALSSTEIQSMIEHFNQPLLQPEHTLSYDAEGWIQIGSGQVQVPIGGEATNATNVCIYSNADRQISVVAEKGFNNASGTDPVGEHWYDFCDRELFDHIAVEYHAIEQVLHSTGLLDNYSEPENNDSYTKTRLYLDSSLKIPDRLIFPTITYAGELPSSSSAEH